MSLAHQHRRTAGVAEQVDPRAERTRDMLGILVALAVVAVIALLTALIG